MHTRTGLTGDETRVVQAVDRALTVNTLTELMAIPSVGGSSAEVDIQHDLAERLAALDLDVQLWPLDLPALTADPEFPGVEVDRTAAYGLVATSRGGSSTGPNGRPALILQGHVDVVPPGDRAAWCSDPFTPVVSAHEVVGRGACDMKGGVAAILSAVRAVQEVGLPLSRRFAVHCVVGEEDGGLGAFGTLASGHDGDACIIPEPTGLTLVTANAGALTFRIEVPGLATHGSTSYAGSSAIDSYLPLHRALKDFEQGRNERPESLMTGFPIAYPLSVGTIRGGDWASTVPDLLVVEGRYGLRIDEDPAEARRQLEEVVQESAARDPFLADHRPRISWPGGQFRGGQLPAGHGLRDLVRSAHTDASGHQMPPERGAPYGSDLRLYAGAEIPTLHYGPGDVRLAHGPNESVPIEELLTASRTLALSIVRSCG
ncbi:MAG: ArgE/DapE family deacylase [Propionibacteriaceae bacterium]